jgi:hypothetical protein
MVEKSWYKFLPTFWNSVVENDPVFYPMKREKIDEKEAFEFLEDFRRKLRWWLSITKRLRHHQHFQHHPSRNTVEAVNVMSISEWGRWAKLEEESFDSNNSNENRIQRNVIGFIYSSNLTSSSYSPKRKRLARFLKWSGLNNDDYSKELHEEAGRTCYVL